MRYIHIMSVDYNLTKRQKKITRNKIRDLKVLQPQDGYRYNVDSLILSEFACPRPRDRILDLGTGCGIIALLIASRLPAAKITGIEVQEELFELACQNVKLNKLEDRVEIIKGDLNQIRKLLPPGSFDYVVTNPPYRPPETGRICLEAQEALARHEILTDLESILKASRYALRPGGRLAIVYPADRSIRLLCTLSAQRLEPKRAKFVHPTPEKMARQILVEARKDAGCELRILPPLFLNP